MDCDAGDIISFVKDNESYPCEYNLADLSQLSKAYRAILWHCCGIDNRTVYIDSDGSVYPCNLLLDKKYLLGNIRERKFSAIWLHAQIKEELCELSVDQFSKCKECEIRYLCGGGCRGTAFNANKDILSPPPNCYEKKETIYSYLWEFAEQDSIYSLLK